MIKKQIDKPKDLSTDSVLSIIEMNLAGRYKTSRVSDSKLNIRRLYRYISANSREVAHKLEKPVKVITQNRNKLTTSTGRS